MPRALQPLAIPRYRGRVSDAPRRRMSPPLLPRVERAARWIAGRQRRRTFRWTIPSISALIVRAILPYRFFGIGDRRRDHVASAGPLAEIEQAAALAAEREVWVGRFRRLLADRAAEFEGAFAGHKSDCGG